ncbi:hypothetical protein, partial [Ralstonia pseudosolanacearum]|uniref:hypothetical protein n=2 Tax=Ralstonia pseudosolanacearum TaxID=1310165 RepID=UPI003CF83CC2
EQRVHTGVATTSTKDTNMDITTANYNAFVVELTALTRKYGVALTAIGGVSIADEPGDFRDVVYVADITSGDLYPQDPEI